jgi:hypothetical protein
VLAISTNVVDSSVIRLWIHGETAVCLEIVYSPSNDSGPNYGTIFLRKKGFVALFVSFPFPNSVSIGVKDLKP